MKLLGFYYEKVYIFDVPDAEIKEYPHTKLTNQDLEEQFARPTSKNVDTVSSYPAMAYDGTDNAKPYADTRAYPDCTQDCTKMNGGCHYCDCEKCPIDAIGI